jgi:flagellar biosynthesis/type III secretory pathway M-ring protein FliF/YscJ
MASISESRIVEERRTMSITAIVILVVIVVAILVIAIVARTVVRRRQLQARFGPEYDRMVEENPNRAAAESDCGPAKSGMQNLT